MENKIGQLFQGWQCDLGKGGLLLEDEPFVMMSFEL